MGRINYYINGVSLRDYGIYVSAAKKLLSLPQRKDGISHEYDNEHGKSVDVSRFFKERKMTVSCFTDVRTNGNFIDTIYAFKQMLIGYGMFQMEVEFAGANRRLCYWCYLGGEMDVVPKYSAAKSMATFDIVLVEPCPVKRVFKVVTTGTNREISLEFSGGDPKYYSIVWGDGSMTDDVTIGDTKVHTYQQVGTYRIMVVGDVTNLTINEDGDNNMNITEEWNLFL